MILATVDIDDVASGKLKDFRGALDETANHVQTFAKAAQGIKSGFDAVDSSTVEKNLRATGAALAEQATRMAALTEQYRAMTTAASSTAAATADLARANNDAARASAAAEAAARSTAAAWEANSNALEKAASGLMNLTGVTNQLATAQLNLQQAQAQQLQAAAAIEAGTIRQVDALSALAEAEKAATEAAAKHATLSANLAEASKYAAQVDAEVAKALEAVNTATTDAAAKAEAYKQALEIQAQVQGAIVQATKDVATAATAAMAAQDGVTQAATNLMAAEQELAIAMDAALTAQKEAAGASEALTESTASATETQKEFALAVHKVATTTDQELLSAVREVSAGFTELHAKTIPGITVTKEMAESLKKLGDQAREAGLLVGPLDNQMKSLVASFVPGVVVTKEMQEGLTGVTQAMQEYGSVVPKVTEATHDHAIGLAAMAVALGAVTEGLREYLVEAAEGAGRGEVLNTIVTQLATTTGNLRGEMLGQIEVMKTLGITTDASTESVIKFAQAQLDVSQAARLARVAQDLGVVANKNSSESFEALTRVIQTQQVQMLRQFGITTTMGAVMRDYAREVGKTTKELTAMDRQQAVLNVILKEGAKATGVYEKSMELAGKQATSLARYQEELSAKIGDRLLPLYRLWITLQTDVLKTLLDMGPGMTAFVTALGVVVTALTGLTAALAAERFLGLMEIFKGLGVSLGLVETAAGAAEVEAVGLAATLGGPLTIAIGVLVVAIALLAGWYVMLAADRQKTLDQSNEELAALAKAQTEYQNYMTAVDELGAIKHRTAEETKQLKEAVDALNKHVGFTVATFNASTQAVDKDAAALRRHARALDEDAEKQVKNNNAKIKELEIALAAAKAKGAAARSAEKGVSQYPGGAMGGLGVVIGSHIASAAADDEAADIARILADLKRNNETLQKAFTVDGKTADAATKRNKWINDMVRSFSDVGVTSLDQILKAVESEGRAGKKLVEKYRQLDKDMAEAKKTRDVNLAPSASDYEAVIQAIDGMYENIANANADAAKKLGEKNKKAFKNAYDNIFEGFNLNSPEIQGRLKGIADQFNQLPTLADGTLDPEEYNRFLTMYGKSLVKLGSANEFYARGADAATASGKKMYETLGLIASIQTNREVGEGVEKQAEEFKKAEKALHDAVIGDDVDQLKRQTENAQAARQASRERVELARSTAEEIRKVDEAIYEQEVVANQSTLEQQIYAANKGIAEAERATAEKLRLMQLEMEEQKKQSEEAVAIIKAQKQQEINTYVDAERLKIVASTRATDEMTAREKDVQAMRQSQRLTELDKFVTDVLNPMRDAAVRSAEEDYGLTKEQQEAKRRLYEETAAAYAGSLDRQKAANDRHIAKMIKDYSLLAQAHKQIWSTLVTSVVDAYKGMIAGTMTWKDALLSIWNSILKAVSSIIDQIVDRWISGAMKMATAEGGFSVSKFVGGLFGRGVGSAASASGSAVAATAAETAAASTLESGTVGLAGGAAGTAATTAGHATTITAGSVLLVGAAGAIGGGIAAHYLADGSRVKGTAYGAAGGAAAGATAAAFIPGIGPLAGAGIGAIVGGIMGWYVARRQRKQMAEERKEFTQQAGGEEALRVKAEEAGVSKDTFDKLMNTESPKEYKKLIDEVSKAIRTLEKDQMVLAAGGEEAFRQMAFEANHFSQEMINGFLAGTLSAKEMQDVLVQMQKDLELKAAKDGLAKTVTQMDNLRKAAVLAGYDLKKLYDATSIEEFNAQQKILNDLLEKQQLRLEGLNTAAQGLALRVSGLVQSYGKGLEGFVSTLSKEQQDAWKKIAEGTKEGEKSLIQRLRESVDVYKGLGGGAKVGDLELTGAQGEELAKILRDVEAQINNISGAALATFGGILRETGDLGAAFEAIGEPLDVLNKLIQETGAEVPQALSRLLSLRSAVQVNKDVVDSLAGITMMLKGLADAGQLTEGLFNDMGKDAATQWETMKKRGVAEDQALMIMQPTLQALYEAQKNFGFATDESTQALIDMGLQQGIVGDQFQSVNQKMLDILMIIAEAVGGTIPDAYRSQTDAQKEAARKAAEAAEAQRKAAEDEARRQDILRQQLELTGGAYEDLGRTTLGDLPGETQKVADALAPLPEAAGTAATKMEDLSETDMLILQAKLEETEKALGVEPGGLAHTAVISKDKLDEINNQDMTQIVGGLGNTESGAYKIVGGAEAATAAILQMVNDTRGPLTEMSDLIDGVSLGHSPGGLKEIRIQSESGAAAIHEMASTASVDLNKLEDEANGYMLSLEDFVARVYEAANEGTAQTKKIVSAPPIAFAERYDPNKPFSIEGDPSPAQMVAYNKVEVQVHIQTLDPSKASEVWQTQIRPQMMKDLDRNHRQFATRIGLTTRAALGPTRKAR